MGWKKCGIYFAGGFIAGNVVLACLDWYEKNFREYKPVEIRFVRNTNKLCKGHVFNKKICSDHVRNVDPTFECSYSIILWMVEFFDSAKKTLDISIYLVTCEGFRDAIVRAFKRGVRVRIFTDYIMSQGTGSAIRIFIKEGIPVRMMELSRMMHRKSAIVDKSRLLMGTGNWTMQALSGNWDLWYQTSEPGAVKAFSKEFETQWAMENNLQPTLEEFDGFKTAPAKDKDKKDGSKDKKDEKQGEKGEEVPKD